MISILLHGCSGRMGRLFTALAEEDPRFSVIVGVDVNASSDNAYPVYTALQNVKEAADIVVDFSTAGAIPALLSYCLEKKLPLLSGTTGLSDDIQQKFKEASSEIPLFWTSNLSLGISLLTELSKRAAAILAPAGFDIEINERHHNKKIDAPSGTALSIGQAVAEELGDPYHLTLDRSAERRQRDPHEIGISAMRGGTIIGEHTVLFAGPDELLEIKHTALSREILVRGALNAAAFLAQQKPGLYSMKDLL